MAPGMESQSKHPSGDKSTEGVKREEEVKKEEEAPPEPALACLRCSKPAKLQCPKCLELKLPRANASFCSQECFKAAWADHKTLHKQPPPPSAPGAPTAPGGGSTGTNGTAGSPGGSVVDAHAQALGQGWLYVLKKGQGRAPAMPRFDWTGALRPFPVSPRLPVPAGIPRPDWASTGRPVEEPASQWQSSVEIKSPEQIARMRRTCVVGREVLDVAARMIKPGVTTDDIDRAVHYATIEAGGYPSPLNYYFFPKSCCTSVNEVVCHGIPDARPLQDGDIVNVDVSVFLDGCHADLNETYFVGTPSPESLNLVRSTMECLEKAIAMVKPGVRFRDLGDVISRHAALQGVSVVKTYCGHGIGELFHCAPNIPHYARNKAVGIMKAGQIFTIEPMINAGGWRDRTWPDGWTSVTADGGRSAQFEHTLLVTDTGCEVLTARLPTSPSVYPWLA